jgi:hypothetical protein
MNGLAGYGWLTPVILVLGRLRSGRLLFEASPENYLMRLPEQKWPRDVAQKQSACFAKKN